MGIIVFSCVSGRISEEDILHCTEDVRLLDASWIRICIVITLCDVATLILPYQTMGDIGIHTEVCFSEKDYVLKRR